jgi:hypothetical protein
MCGVFFCGCRDCMRSGISMRASQTCCFVSFRKARQTVIKFVTKKEKLESRGKMGGWVRESSHALLAFAHPDTDGVRRLQRSRLEIPSGSNQSCKDGVFILLRVVTDVAFVLVVAL